jgi:4-hydroxybenzoate polyprenyltransferase
MSDKNDTAQSNRFSDLLVRSIDRPRITVHDVIHGWWVTSRMEYLAEAIVRIILPLLLVLRHEPWRTELLELSFWGLVVWLMGHWVGSSLNCLADYPIDRLDTGHKARLALAIDRTGVRPILLVNFVESLVATVVSSWLALRLAKPLLPVFWLAGLMVANLYSFEPVRFKRRNLLNPAALTLIVYLLPLFFVYHLLSPVWDNYDTAVLITYCLQMVPMFLVDEVSDYDEDRATKTYNPCVTYGRVRVSWFANGIYLLACLTSLILYASEVATWSAGRIGALIIASLAYLWVVREFILLARLSQAINRALDANSRLERTQTLKKFSKTPAWLFATSIGALLLALAVTSL